MAEAVVSVALETLRDLLLEERKFLAGVGAEVKLLQKHLKEIKCFLKDADTKKHKSETVRNWTVEIKDLAYRAEDVISEYAVRRYSDGWRRFLRRSSLHQLGSEILSIKSELERITKDLKNYGIRNVIDGGESSSASLSQNWERKTFPNFEIDECFVGKEDELKQLVSLVSDEKYRVISVWGMGGIGKTTIAKKVYNQMIEAKPCCFDSFAWVCITQQCQIRWVLEDVLQQLTRQKGEDFSNLTDTQLMEQLGEIQRAKRCFVVLDDLWETSHWDAFKHAFLVHGLQSKILVTTRKKMVANIGFSLELGLLNMDEAWELLKKKSFPDTKIPDFTSQEKLYEIGQEMVHKCGYLPLAISLLGGVLSRKKSMKGWELVNANINASIYRGEGLDQKENQMERVLNLSYEDLPYYLKPCFLFLGRYREDETINILDLYWMWIALGMVSYENIQGKGETLMEIAELYLSDLASRSLVQVEVDEDAMPTLKYRSCKLHGVVREFCLSMGKIEEFGVQILECQDGKFKTLLQEALLCAKTRHLVIHLQRELHLDHHELANAWKEDGSKHLRSLEIRSDINKKTIGFLPRNLVDFQKLKMLRGLAIVRFKFAGGKLPRGITDLVHLKCLRLHECELDMLPSSIGDLVHLETLDLLKSWNVQIPNVLKKMTRLKHLILPRYDVETVGRYRLRLDEGLDELESLCEFNSSVHELNSIMKMKNLRRLTATITDNKSLSYIINAITRNWSKLLNCAVIIGRGCELATSEEGLKKLKQSFQCPNLHYLSIYVGLGKLLQQCKSNMIGSNLKGLSLRKCEIEDDPMEILGKLPCLRELYLYEGSFVGEEMMCRSSSFPCLKKLVLESLLKLRKWNVETGAMPLLSKIRIRNCLRFEKVPEGLIGISTLKKLTIKGMPELGKRVLISGEDFHLVRHVPTIIIHDSHSG